MRIKRIAWYTVRLLTSRSMTMPNFKTITIEITNGQPGMRALVTTTFEDGRTLNVDAHLTPDVTDTAVLGYAVAEAMTQSARAAHERGYAMPNLADLTHGMFCAAFDDRMKH